MTVHAFRMQLKPGTAEEYRRRHDEIWLELTALLSVAGISAYRFSSILRHFRSLPC